jgi:hypothetical protein
MTEEFKRGDLVSARQDTPYWGDHWRDGVVEAATINGKYIIRWDHAHTRAWPASAGPRPNTSLVAAENVRRR